MLVMNSQGLWETSYPLTTRELVEAARQLALKDAPRNFITSPTEVRRYLSTCVLGLEHEVFGVVWLNTKHGVITTEILFRGTIDHTSVPIREVVKEALYKNAHSCVLFHNHPSGNAQPSSADKHLTEKLKEALHLIGVNVLDHFVCCEREMYSFAEHNEI